MNRQGRRGNSIATMMLLYQLFMAANETGIPPVTLTFIGFQICLFLRIIAVPWTFPAEICMSYDRIWHYRDYKRFLLGAFEHGDDFHLYYNMLSLLAKGRTLEKLYGSGYFAFMLIVFTAFTNAVYLFLNYALAILLWDSSFYYSCAVGFSGTLFALKVVTTSLMESSFGLSSSVTKWGVWFELLYISFITPNTSFVGHLAGILVGFLYTKGPLKPIMLSIWDVVMAFWNSVNPPNPNQHDDYDEAQRFRAQQQRNYENQQYQNQYFRRRQGYNNMF